MPDEHKYWNTSTDVVSKQYGVVVISVQAATYVSSVPCKECWIKTKAANTVYINFDAVAAATVGFPLTDATALNSVQGVCQIGPLAISNLSSISLFGVAVATVWVLWRA